MFEVKFADIGEGIHEGVIFKFEVEVGQEIEDGDTLFLVETDKVTAEIPSSVSGIVKTIHFKEGDTINVGNTIVTIDDLQTSDLSEVTLEKDNIEETHEIVSEQGSTSVVGDLEISSAVIASSEEVDEKVSQSVHKKILATPVARKLAKDLNIDIYTIIGTGPAGRVKKADIYSAVKKSEEVTVVKVEKVNDHSEHRVKMSTIRKTIAEKMTVSKFTIPHTAVMDEVHVDQLVQFRNETKLIARQKNVKLTYLPFIIKAVTIALKQHEIVNASVDMNAHEVIMHHDIHIGIAVDTPSGLMVPVIKNANQLSILELADKIEDLSARAQTKSLHLDEISGSTFTITNYGAFGSSFGVPVINFPEAAILGLGKIDKKPIVVNDAIGIGYIMPLSMSFDHRIVDGADAGRFISTLKELLSSPQLLLLS